MSVQRRDDYDDVNSLPGADQEAIAKTLSLLLDGFQQRDASRFVDVYSEDADWVNAFGCVKSGSLEIVAYLDGLFADSNFDAGELIRSPQSTLRRLTHDIVTVSTHLQIRGQGLVGGGTIPLRDNHSLRILQKQADDQWLIVSEMYMDARTESSYINHS